MALITIVDNDKDTRDSLKSLLEKNGYEISVAKNVDDCIKKLDKEVPDLILLDLFMPGKPVNELIEKFTNIKFIIISAYLSENLEKSIPDEKLRDCLKLPNVVANIPKPYDNDELLELVKKHT